ncbi:MAG: ABC transporter permease, partial [Oscillospiraceae bacterium]
MFDMLQNIFSASFVYSVFRVTTPILFAALGIMISKKAGVTNIAMEGIMLASALAGVIGSALTQSLLLGLIFAVIIGHIMSGI